MMHGQVVDSFESVSAWKILKSCNFPWLLLWHTLKPKLQCSASESPINDQHLSHAGREKNQMKCEYQANAS